MTVGELRGQREGAIGSRVGKPTVSQVGRAGGTGRDSMSQRPSQLCRTWSRSSCCCLCSPSASPCPA